MAEERLNPVSQNVSNMSNQEDSLNEMLDQNEAIPQHRNNYQMPSQSLAVIPQTNNSSELDNLVYRPNS